MLLSDIVSWNHTASVREDFALLSIVPDVPIEEGMVHVVSAPNAIFSTVGELANQSN